MNFCCLEMQNIVEEKRIPIFYDNKIRMFGIEVLNSQSVQKINFCPWCGSKLPESLRDQYFNELSNALHKEAGIDDIEKAPKEFQTDEWWRKRGL